MAEEIKKMNASDEKLVLSKHFKSGTKFGQQAHYIPVCFCIDFSGSMRTIDTEAGGYSESIREEFVDGRNVQIVTGGTCYMDYVTRGINKFFEGLRSDENCKYVETAVVGFNNETFVVQNFTPIAEQQDFDESEMLGRCEGDTHMGDGLRVCYDLLKEQKAKYSKDKKHYYQPWLVIFTDGRAQDTEEVERIKKIIHADEADDKILVFPIAVLKRQDLIDSIKGLSSKQEPIFYDKPEEITKFFDFLKSSMSLMATGTKPGSYAVETDTDKPATPTVTPKPTTNKPKPKPAQPKKPSVPNFFDQDVEEDEGPIVDEQDTSDSKKGGFKFWAD